MRIIRNHNMSRQDAKAWIEDQLTTLLEQDRGNVSEAQHVWRGDTLEFAGRRGPFKIHGTVQVDDSRLLMDLDGIPFLFRGKAGTEIERWLDNNLPR